MWRKTIANAVQFPFQKLPVKGSLPKGIHGRFFRNGPSQFTIGKDVLQHWFIGDGMIFMLECKNDQCWGQAKFVDTPIRRQRLQTNQISDNFITKFTKYKNVDPSAVNTSVHALNSEHLLALAQGGKPFVMNKKNLDSIGFNDFGWIKTAYSAHPKIDPANKDIYNIGTDFQNWTLTLSHCTKDMKLIKSHIMKLRSLQSIHDFCLAGDYVVVFESSMNLSYKNFLFSPTILQSLVFNENLPKLVHIFRKSDFSHVKTIETPPSFMFHFGNGFSNDNKLVIQYCNYAPKQAKELFGLLQHMPQYAAGSEKSFKTFSQLQQIQINLKTFDFQIQNHKELAEFPVCEDHETGKEWRYTYCALFNEKSYWNSIARFDRIDKRWLINSLGDEAFVGQPITIRIGSKVYLLAMVNQHKKSSVQFFDADNLERICTVDLPGFIPTGFHGKWDTEL